MYRKKTTSTYILVLLILTSLSCGLIGGRTGGDQPSAPVGEQPAKQETRQIIRQWASSATASSEYSNPEWAAHQATGEPDTLQCGDKETAWASYDDFTKEWLEVRYDTPVTPTEINIYESHTPTQVVRVEVIDTGGNYHEVYTAEPRNEPECPYILSVKVEAASYQAVGIKISIDQSQIDMPWDEIDAVELVGYGEETTGGQSAQEPSGGDSQPAGGGGQAAENLAGTWTVYSTDAGLPNEEVHAVALAKDGTLWIASGVFGQQQISSFKNGSFTNHDTSAVTPSISMNHYSLTVAPDGTVWAATGTRLISYDGKNWTSYSKENGLQDDATKSVAIAPDGSLWLGSVEGVSHFDGKSWTHYTKDDGLVDTFIEAIAITPQGDLWFVSSFNGVSQFNGKKKWTSYLKGDELPNFPHSSAAVGPDGSVWIGSGGGGVSRFDGKNWETYTVSDAFDLEYVKAIVQAPDGSIWIGTEGDGLYRFDGQNWMNFRKADGLCYDYVDTIAAAPDGSVWVGCRKNGIAHFEPAK